MTDLIKSVLWAIELLGGLAILPIIYDIDVAELGALGLLAIGIDLGVRALIAGTTIDVPRGLIKCPDTLPVCPEEIPVNCTIRSAVIQYSSYGSTTVL